MASDARPPIPSAADQSVIRLIAGECRVELAGESEAVHHGHLVTILKPDDTILVHDSDGYTPVAWLTRAESVTADAEEHVITAVDGDQWLRIDITNATIDNTIPATLAGNAIGTCPDCGGTLVEAESTVTCLGCREQFGIPGDSTILAEEFCECGLPQMRVERGATLELCIDRSCEPMEAALADRFDGAWGCPTTGCPGRLRIIRRGRILAACDQYPDCETAFHFPVGVLDGNCGCGLPKFATEDAVRCLDASCSG